MGNWAIITIHVQEDEIERKIGLEKAKLIIIMPN